MVQQEPKKKKKKDKFFYLGIGKRSVPKPKEGSLGYDTGPSPFPRQTEPLSA